ncbi:MAG: lipocalin family protein [Bacteroidia bacterium]
MKKPIQIMLCLVLISLLSCGGKKSDMLIGTWKFEHGEFNTAMQKASPEMKATLEAQFKEMNENMKKTYTWTFNKDGSSNASYQGTAYKGKWTLSEDGKLLVSVMDVDGKKDTCRILELNPGKLTFTQTDEKGDLSTTTFVKP